MVVLASFLPPKQKLAQYNPVSGTFKICATFAEDLCPFHIFYWNKNNGHIPLL